MEVYLKKSMRCCVQRAEVVEGCHDDGVSMEKNLLIFVDLEFLGFNLGDPEFSSKGRVLALLGRPLCTYYQPTSLSTPPHHDRGL